MNWLIDSVGSSYMTSAATTSAFSLISLSSLPPLSDAAKLELSGTEATNACGFLPEVW